MISCIICSRNKQDFQKIKENIATTIGVAHEIIEVDNTTNQFSICAAYNWGAARAIHPYLCFLHEDIQLITPNWGQNALIHFQNDTSLGLVGVAGSTCKSKTLSPWKQPCMDAYEPKRMRIIQAYKFEKKDTVEQTINPLNEKISQVATLDGVFLMTKKTIWEEIKWDETLLTGFHGYDLAYSLAICQKYRIAVVFDILLHHFSEGNREGASYIDLLKVHKKYAAILPIEDSAIPKSSFYAFEIANYWHSIVLLYRKKVPTYLILAYSCRTLPYFWGSFEYIRYAMIFIKQALLSPNKYIKSAREKYFS